MIGLRLNDCGGLGASRGTQATFCPAGGNNYRYIYVDKYKEKQILMKRIYSLLVALAVLVALVACEGDHVVIETDWTTLETVELNKQYRKYMDGEWVYQYDDSIHFIELYYTFNIKDSTMTGYYNELVRTNISVDGSPEHDEWQLLWQGSLSGKWELLHSVELDHAYIYMEQMVYKNVHGVLAKYDVLAGRVLFYGANKHTLRVTSPLTFRRIDMHHPEEL